MLRFIVQFLVTCLALWLAAQVVPGVAFSDTPSLLLAAVLLGVANAIVRPVLTVLTFPLTLLTFGLFLLVLNAAMLGLTALLMPGLSIDGFGPAVLGAIVVSVVSWVARRAFAPPAPA